MSTRLLTNLLFEPKGKHDPALTYSIKDTVMSEDGSQVYFALRDVPAGIALSDERYWKLQIDLSGSKNAMDEAVANFSDYAKIVGTRVRGETAKVTGNPVTLLPDAGSLLQPVTVLEPKQQGSGDPYPAGGGRNLIGGWEQGGVNSSGEEFDTNTVIRSAATKVTGKDVYVTVPPSYGFFLGEYNNGAYIDRVYSSTSRAVTLSANTTHVRLLLVKNDGSEITPAEAVGYQVEYGTVGTEVVPYSNIRPFIGYDALDLTAAGKNLFDSSIITDSTQWVNKRITLSPNTTYIMSANIPDEVSAFAGFYAYNSKGEASGAVNKVYRSRPVVVTTLEDGIIEFQWITDAEHPLTAYQYQLELGSAATPYATYQGKLHTVQIGQTVYGFRYEWLTGKFAKTHIPFADYASMVYNSSNNAGDGSIFYVVGDFVRNGATSSILANSTANPWEALSVNTMRVDDGYLIVCVPNSITTPGELAAYMEGQMIVYKLATPIEIQLTPHIISAADPEQTNTLYGDGTIETTYVKPLHVSIEERVAAAMAALVTE